MDIQKRLALLDKVQDIKNLLEVKMLKGLPGTSKTNIGRRDIIADIWKLPLSVRKVHKGQAKAIWKYEFKKLQKRFENALVKEFTKFIKNEINKTELYRKVVNIHKYFYVKAFQYGIMSMGIEKFVKKDRTGLPVLDEKEQKWLNKLIEEDKKYLIKFIEYVSKGAQKVSISYIKNRAKYYKETLQVAFDASKISLTPEGIALYWVVDIHAEHCESCLWLEKQSPFLPENLPTLPKAGDTICKVGCKCKIVQGKVSASRLKNLWKKSQTTNTRDRLRAKLLSFLK